MCTESIKKVNQKDHYIYLLAQTYIIRMNCNQKQIVLQFRKNCATLIYQTKMQACKLKYRKTGCETCPILKKNLWTIHHYFLLFQMNFDQVDKDELTSRVECKQGHFIYLVVLFEHGCLLTVQKIIFSGQLIKK